MTPKTRPRPIAPSVATLGRLQVWSAAAAANGIGRTRLPRQHRSLRSHGRVCGLSQGEWVRACGCTEGSAKACRAAAGTDHATKCGVSELSRCLAGDPRSLMGSARTRCGNVVAPPVKNRRSKIARFGIEVGGKTRGGIARRLLDSGCRALFQLRLTLMLEALRGSREGLKSRDQEDGHDSGSSVHVNLLSWGVIHTPVDSAPTVDGARAPFYDLIGWPRALQQAIPSSIL